MTRRAFTLVELLVVVSIIAMLVALLMPELTASRALARAAICRHNLRQIGTAFDAAGPALTDQGKAPTRYPGPMDWPGNPYEKCPDKGIFLCPEDDPGDFNPISLWTVTTEYTDGLYANAGPRFVIHMEPPSWGCDRRPGDGFVDYAFEDGPGIVTDPASWGYDGTFRVFTQAGQAKKVVLHWRTCGQDNRTQLGQEPLYPAYGDVRLIQIPEGTFRVIGGVYTSYALNTQVGRHEVAPGTVVLLDYDTTEGPIADPQAAGVWSKIVAGARHRGRNNVLYSDGSIRSSGPSALDPRIDADPWSP